MSVMTGYPGTNPIPLLNWLTMLLVFSLILILCRILENWLSTRFDKVKLHLRHFIRSALYMDTILTYN